MSLDAYLNSEADEIATTGLTRLQEKPQVPMDPNTTLQFNIRGRTITRDFKRGVFRVVLGAIGYYARYLATRKILLKLLRIESHHHDNGNVSNRTSMGTNLFNTNLSDEL
jgi:hypothetical protein